MAPKEFALTPPIAARASVSQAPEPTTSHGGGGRAAAARRLIIASTSRRSSARPVSRRPAGSTVWKSVTFRLLKPARLDVGVEGRGRPVVDPSREASTSPGLPCPK